MGPGAIVPPSRWPCCDVTAFEFIAVVCNPQTAAGRKQAKFEPYMAMDERFMQ